MRNDLLAGACAAAIACVWSGSASAQTTAGPEANQLSEVVVTATRQAENINRIPLSISAQTQRSLDQRGIRDIRDLQAQVPALRVTAAGNGGSATATIAIRGITQATVGAATTGIYLDETPVMRRNLGQSAAPVNGTPLPALFDLERVEVLRGPQGTLFGGSSQGGTIRYIQVAPSLTSYSAYARAMYSTTKYGSASRELSLASGGPIIEDKLGFRVSASHQRTGGYIDVVNPLTRAVREDANDVERNSIRGALRWQATDRLLVTGSLFHSRIFDKDNSGAANLDTDLPLTVPQLCYNTNNTPGGGSFNAQGINTSARVGPLTGLAFTATARNVPNPVARGDAACNQLRANGDVTWSTPGYSLGPYDLEPFQRLGTDGNQTSTRQIIGSFDMLYEFDTFDVKAITSYLTDYSKLDNGASFLVDRVSAGTAGSTGGAAINAMYGTNVIPSGTAYPVLPGIGNNFYQPTRFVGASERHQFTQELRFSSKPTQRPFSWVAGIYYSNSRQKVDSILTYNRDIVFAQYGVNLFQRYGVQDTELPGVMDLYNKQYQKAQDVDVAAFAEGNYWVTDRLRLTAGIRFTRTTFSFYQVEQGLSVAIGPTSPLPERRAPTLANQGIGEGSTTESPITPKFSAQYQLSDNSFVYASAAKGFRAGGVNSPLPGAAAGDQLARNYGATVFDVPKTYESDTVWSYEAGAKVRLLRRLQINAALYRIDWKNTQFAANVGQTFITNVDGLKSRGFEAELEAAVFRGLTMYSAFGYNKSNYTKASPAKLLNGALVPTVLDNQRVAAPKWTASVGGRYDFALTDSARAYLRADWRWTQGFINNPFGTTGYNPDSNITPAQQLTNFRAGVEFGDFDLNLFVNNVFEASKANTSGGRSQCALPQNGGTPACTVYSAYNPFRAQTLPRPREVGLQLVYRH